MSDSGYRTALMSLFLPLGSVAGATMGDLLTAKGVPHAVIDLDRVRQAWPPPEGGPFNHRLELVNLAS
jgi:hypothetical protein